MKDSVLKQVAGLKNLTYEELRQLYTTLHGKNPPAYNRDFLVKRVAYRIQELAYGGLSERTQERLDQALVLHGYDQNAMPKHSKVGRPRVIRDHPIVGSLFVREWRGTRYEVKTLADGFEFEGRKYKSLSAVAKVITGTHWNGKVFFGINPGRTA